MGARRTYHSQHILCYITFSGICLKGIGKMRGRRLDPAPHGFRRIGASSASWGFIVLRNDHYGMMEGGLGCLSDDVSSRREFLLLFGIVASTLVALGITGYCLSSGVFVVCSHLFYIPIVLAAYRYPDRGVGIAVALAAAYLAEVLLLSPGGGAEITDALVRAGVFLLVAVVVSHLAGRLHLREGRYRGIFETSGAGIFLFSPDGGEVEEMNRQCAAMLGYPDGEVPDLVAFWPGYPGNPAPVTNQDCEFIRRDGTSCPVLLSTSLLPDREMACAVVTGMTEQKRMENLLRRSEETFRVILNTVDVGIILTDPGRQIIEVNEAMVRLCGGAAREDLIGRDPETLFAERDLAMIRACRERVLHGEVLAPVECMLCRLDGSEWPAEVSVTLLAKDGDAPERLILAIRDITGLRRVEAEMREENRRLSITSEVITAATASRHLDDLLPVSLEKTLALLDFDLGGAYLVYPGSDLAHLRACVGEGHAPARVRRDEPPYRYVLVDGEARFVDRFQERYPGHDDPAIRSFAAVPIPGDDGPVGCIAVASRTRETIPEDERLILATIGEEIGSAVVKGMLLEELEAALASANRYLDEANAATEAVNLYVDILTHDINNANTAAMGYLYMILDSAEEPTREVIRKSLAAIYQSNDIIRNVSTIRRLMLEAAPLQLVRLEPVIRGMRNYYADARIVYEGSDATVLADDLISEVFANLIGNAVKFGGPDVEVTISVREEGEDRVAVTVADTGPGIPDDLKPRIFERKERGVTKKSGKGLGLSIVRMLAERYGGSVRAGDRVPGRPEEGAAITVTLLRYCPEGG